MAAIDASRLLRPALLRGTGVLLADAAPGAAGDAAGMGGAAGSACEGLGARVAWCAPPAGGSTEEQESAADRTVAGALEQLGAIDVVVLDAAATFDTAPGDAAAESSREDAAARLGACLLATWTLTRSVFQLAFLPRARGGRIVYLAPAAGGGEHSEPARAGLENLSRTLSIEWARHGVTAVTIAPGAATAAGEVAALVAYLASPAGAYFSGCQLDLRGVHARAS